MLKKLRLFCRLSLRRKCLLLFTMGLSFYVFLLMTFFNQYASFGKKATNSISQNIENQIIADIRWAIFMVSKYSLWENVCRHQAYQAMFLCRFYNIPYQIFVGFKKAEYGKINGHAWTMVGGQMITGFCNADEYVIQTIYT